MLESTDNIGQKEYRFLDDNKYWVPSTSDKYIECLEGFFPDGIKFNGSILTRKILIDNNLTEFYTEIGNSEEKLDKEISLKLHLKSSEFGGFNVIITIADGVTMDFNINPTFKTISTSGTLNDLSTYSFDFDNNELYLQFTPKVLQTNGYKVELTNFTPIDYIFLSEYIYRESDLNFIVKGIPQMDSSDLCAFLWMANKDKILTKKIFSSKTLIENKFSEIDFVKKFNFGEYLKKESYQELLANSLPGDIYVFKQNDTYHSIFIIDPIKNYYTECSSKIEYELGYFYNGKINPYDFEKRVKELATNSTLFHVRLN